MSTKALLKAAKTAIDSKKWDEALSQATSVLALDPSNYFAHLFLGRAHDALADYAASATAYLSATALKPSEPQAWLGLRGLYEKQGAAKVDENTDVGAQLAALYAAAEDAHRAQSAVDKAVDFARKHGGPAQYARALKIQLPGSPVYEFLEGRVPSPELTYLRIAELWEEEERRVIAKQIEERKTRIGATLEGVTQQVRREVFGASELEGVYEQIIDWTHDDGVRREFEEKLLRRVYDHMVVAPAGQKEEKREKVMKLAHDMVIIKHPYLLAWEIELEWRSGLDIEVC